MQGISIQIENASAVQKALDGFEKKISKKIVRQGVRAAWKPLLNKSKQNARTNVGGQMGSLIAKNLQLRAWRRQRKGQYGMMVRIKSGIPEFLSFAKGARTFLRWRSDIETRRVSYRAGKTTGQAYIPSAIEYGHAFPYHGGKGANKDVAAIPFMRPALDLALPNAPKIFQQHLESAIAEENAKR